MHIAQLISDVIYYLQGSHPQDTQWTQRSPTGPWGFQLGLRASVSHTGCPSPPARSYHHDIGKYALLYLSQFFPTSPHSFFPLFSLVLTNSPHSPPFPSLCAMHARLLQLTTLYNPNFSSASYTHCSHSISYMRVPVSSSFTIH